MPETVAVDIRVADMPQVKVMIDAVADLLGDPYETELHARCTHVPCTWQQLRARARELADA